MVEQVESLRIVERVEQSVKDGYRQSCRKFDVWCDLASPRGCLDPLHYQEYEFGVRTGKKLSWLTDGLELATEKAQSIVMTYKSSPALAGYGLFNRLQQFLGADSIVTITNSFSGCLGFRSIFSLHETLLAFMSGIPSGLVAQAWEVHAKEILGSRFTGNEFGYTLESVEIEEVKEIGLLVGYSPLIAQVEFRKSGKVVGTFAGTEESDFELGLIQSYG